MLIIGTKPGDYVIINKSITVKLVKRKNGALRLAIHAPKDIVIEKGKPPEYEQQLYVWINSNVFLLWLGKLRAKVWFFLYVLYAIIFNKVLS